MAERTTPAKKIKRVIRSPLKQKLLMLLYSGMAMGLTRSPRTSQYILKNIPKEFEEINKEYLRQAVIEFRRDRLIDYREEDDGTITMTLSELGQKQVLRFKLDEMVIKPQKSWDKLWRAVVFDIPEKHKRVREALRSKLKELGFIELQHSVWIYPYPCEEEINFIIEVFEIRHHVRLMEVYSITNEADLLLQFGLKI